MAMAQQYHAPAERLPIELRQAILFALPSISSLKALVRTCTSFYHAFLDAKLLIITAV